MSTALAHPDRLTRPGQLVHLAEYALAGCSTQAEKRIYLEFFKMQPGGIPSKLVHAPGQRAFSINTSRGLVFLWSPDGTFESEESLDDWFGANAAVEVVLWSDWSGAAHSLRSAASKTNANLRGMFT